MRDSKGDHQIVDMIGEEFEKLKDLRSFNFDPKTFLVLTNGGNNTDYSEGEPNRKYL